MTREREMTKKMTRENGPVETTKVVQAMGDMVELTSEPLDMDRCLKWVEDSTTGAVAIFKGITRDRFEGKKVVRLEYEAYRPMVIARLQQICNEARNTCKLTKIAIVHRTGVVAVGEASIIIVISSVHRKDALDAVEYAINQIKATVPIWKKEIYEEGDETWKENKEFIEFKKVMRWCC